MAIPVNTLKEFSAANTDTTVYTVSTNRKLTVTDIVVTNKETSAVLITIWDGASATGTKKMEIEVPPTTTGMLLRMQHGPEFRTSVVAQVSAYTNGSSIMIGGEER